MNIKIKAADTCKNSPISHGDIMVEGDIHICVSTDLNE